MTGRCLVCEEPTSEDDHICVSCAEAFLQEDEEEEAEIGVATNAKLTEGFRILKGQGE